MSNEPQNGELHDYAGGWITERKGTKIPGFLKLAYPVILVAVITYLVLYMNGEIHHSTRGPLVQQLNAVTGTANTFMYVVMAMIVLFGIILISFVMKKSDHEE